MLLETAFGYNSRRCNAVKVCLGGIVVILLCYLYLCVRVPVHNYVVRQFVASAENIKLVKYPDTHDNVDEAVEKYLEHEKQLLMEEDHGTEIHIRKQHPFENATQPSYVNLTESGTIVDVVILFTNAKHNARLIQKFSVTVKSIIVYSSVCINFHIIADQDSRLIAGDILSPIIQSKQLEGKKDNDHPLLFQVNYLDVDTLAKELQQVILPFQSLFSKHGAYYSDAIFYLSTAIHKVVDFHKVILLDCDLKFTADIKLLYREFEKFTNTNVIGIAHEMQPVYRHVFHMYRRSNPETRVGSPPPSGLTGFNSGVMLLDLDKMRKSGLYNQFLDEKVISNLAAKYIFKGHLGDQDLFTLISLEHSELFHILPCTWNYQLCKWWKDNGYNDVFYQYHACLGEVKVYHGNCGSPIPE